ncbi:hypothetical protein BHY_0226 [Borrelia nietonii YOR]|uniref:Uncharacterized protein n=1 Tax=Borrelia nietonii YOR TaxID=1293576 RepID=A0ABN4C8X5_9SPIR|nr:hypothetical protein BHY_0226 [Borrelia nietonii YOR]
MEEKFTIKSLNLSLKKMLTENKINMEADNDQNS